MNRKFSLLACSILGSGLMMSPLPAQAQQADQPAAAGGTGLEEIVVTARRREEKLQTVPIAIEAFGGQALQEHKIEGIEDLSRLVPALVQVQTVRNKEGLDIRGLGNSGASAQGESNSVTTYYAEVPLPTGDAMGYGRYYDLDNAQVLQGPQGTLFGRNSTGGALLIQPKKPTNNFEGYVQAQFGNYSDEEFQAAINVPIIKDVLLVRFAGERVSRDGFTYDVTTKQELDNRDSWSGRGSIIYRPTDSIENYFVYDSYYSHTAGTSELLDYVNPNFTISSVAAAGCNIPVTLAGSGRVPGFNYGAAAFCPTLAGGRVALIPGPGVANALAQQQALGIRETLGGVRGLDIEESNGATDIATWNIDDDLTLKNIFGLREYKTAAKYDPDGTPFTILDELNNGGWVVNTVQYSEELQLQGKSFNDALVWTLGDFALYSHAAGNENTDINAFGTTTVSNADPVERSEAVFGEATYDLGNLTPVLDGLKFTGGMRYTWDFRRLFEASKKSTGACSLGTLAGGCAIDLATEFKAPTWNVSLAYQLDPSTLLYVTGRRGYRSGGLNTQSGSVVSPEFQPEHLTDVEIGVKSDWVLMGVEARTNLAAYHSNFSNAQLSEAGTVLINGVASPINAIVNAASAEIQGLNFDTTIVPVKGVQITGSWAYTQATYQNVINVFNPNAGASQRPYPFVSRNKFVVDAQYTLPLPEDLGPITAGVTWSFASHQSLSVLQDPDGNQSAFRNINLRLGWNDILGYPVDATAFMTNATNNAYKIGGFPIGTSLGFDSYLWDEPRMFGFSLKYRFGGPAEEAAATQAAYVPPAAQAPAPAPKSYLVFFDFNKSDLTPQAMQIVNTAASNAGPAHVTQLTVTGHTDTVGSDAYNMRLSKRRAESVAAQLEKDGIPSSEIEIVAKGKRDLLVPTKDGVREPQNRRVQIVYDGAAS
jgi:iron complex outermembrane receptor protein